MHPFSLNKKEQQSVNGGFIIETPIKDSITFGIGETGDHITMAYPEDGHDPFPFPIDFM